METGGGVGWRAVRVRGECCGDLRGVLRLGDSLVHLSGEVALLSGEVALIRGEVVLVPGGWL